MFPILQVGPLAIQVPGLVLLAGLWIGITLSEKTAPKRNIKSDTLYNLIFIALLAGLLGARLSYAGRFPAAFAQSPASLVSLNPGLLDPVGGLVFAALGALIFGQRKGLRLWRTLDALTPLFGTLVIAFALSNLASGRGFGAESQLPWAIEIWGALRHPSQVYEAAVGLFILVFLWPLAQKPANRTEGFLFLVFLILTASARLFLEAFRGDSLTVFAGVRTDQLAAWLVLAGGLLVLYQRLFRAQRKSSS